MRKIARKLLMLALSTMLLGAGTTAVYDACNEQTAVTALAEAKGAENTAYGAIDNANVYFEEETPVAGLPEDGSTLTIAEALALDMSAYAGQKYYVEGTVVRYSDPYKGGLYIADTEGNEICIYGLKIVYSKYYTKTFKEMWYSDKPLVGSTVQFYGEMSVYNNANQFIDAEFKILERPAEDPEGQLPNDSAAITIAEVLALSVEKDTMRQYCVEGVIAEIVNTQYGDMYIEDEEGNRLYVCGLYDMWTEVRYDSMESQPTVGDTVKLKSILSVSDGQIQLKNARLTDYTPAPIVLNLNGTTTLEIPAGITIVTVGIPDAANFTGSYVLTWDDVNVTNLKVGSNVNAQSGIILEHASSDEPFELKFSTTDFAALTIDVTIVPYVEVIPQFFIGENAIEVTDADHGTLVQFFLAGTYAFAWAEGEENGIIMVKTDYGASILEMPYTFTVAEGELYEFLVFTQSYMDDEINVVVTLVEEPTDNPADDSTHDSTNDSTDKPTDDSANDSANDSTDKPTEKPEQPKENSSILDKVADKVSGFINGCFGTVGGIAGSLTALGVAIVAVLKKKED